MDAVTPIDRFREQLRASGIGDDRPLHAVLLTVYETSLETRAIVGTAARGLSEAGERELIERLAHNAVDVTSQEVERLVHKISFRTSLLMALAGLALLAAGFLWGQWNAPGRGGFLGDVQAANDVGAMQSFCAAHTFQREGKTACQLPPVWVKP